MNVKLRKTREAATQIGNVCLQCEKPKKKEFSEDFTSSMSKRYVHSFIITIVGLFIHYYDAKHVHTIQQYVSVRIHRHTSHKLRPLKWFMVQVHW